MEEKDKLKELKNVLKEINIENINDKINSEEETNSNKEYGNEQYLSKPKTKVLVKGNRTSIGGFISIVLVCAVSTVVGILAAAILFINR